MRKHDLNGPLANFSPLVSDDEKLEFARLVADRYEKEFGDRLTVDQILEPNQEHRVVIERGSSGAIVAGAKLAPFEGSFTQRCMGERRVQELFDDDDLIDQVVEVSKVVNVGGLLTIHQLLFKTCQLLSQHSTYGFVSCGPQKTMMLWKRTMDWVYRRRWDTKVVPIPEPAVDIPDHIDLSVLWAKNRS